MDLTTTVLYSIGGYLLILIIMGIIANRRRKSNSLNDFYLAGGGLGSFVLLLTLYATQYSANTMLVTPAEVVNRGLGMIMILGYMTAIVVFYLTFAPQLYRISKGMHFITPGDWFDYRFKMPKLTLFANIILVLVSVNFLLSQLIAMGHISQGITGGQIPYWAGVVFLALVVILYETLGGMRAVAWTDVVQGIMLVAGLMGIFIMLVPDVDELTSISLWLLENEPRKIGVPEPGFRVYWASTVIMLGLGGAVYPQVVQRIYAAKSLTSLKNALGGMIYMPLITVLILFLLGVISIPYFADAEQVGGDQVLPTMLSRWSGESNLALGLTTMVIVALLAAIMSTADSVLLSLSSIIAKDILSISLLKGVKEERLTKWGKIMSWIIMLCLVLMALQPNITLWGLIELKMQLLVQIAPLFLLGIYYPKARAKAMMAGLISGSTMVLIAFLMDWKTIGNIQSGMIALTINLLVCYSYSQILEKRALQPNAKARDGLNSTESVEINK